VTITEPITVTQKNIHGALNQFCIVHLQQDFKNCMDHVDPLVINYGKKLKIAFRNLIALYRNYLDIIEIKEKS
jgi:hypothetical protein